MTNLTNLSQTEFNRLIKTSEVKAFSDMIEVYLKLNGITTELCVVAEEEFQINISELEFEATSEQLQEIQELINDNIIKEESFYEVSDEYFDKGVQRSNFY